MEQVEQITDPVIEEATAEEPAPVEAEQPLAADSMATPAGEPAAEQPAPEQVAEEPAKEPAPVVEAPATPSDKYEIRNSDGNYIAFVNEVVTANANRCLDISLVMDKIEESRVRLVIQIARMDGSKIGVFPVAIEKGGTKASFEWCPPAGGIFDAIEAGGQYKLSFTRAQL